jgi:hypothetical protein
MFCCNCADTIFTVPATGVLNVIVVTLALVEVIDVGMIT